MIPTFSVMCDLRRLNACRKLKTANSRGKPLPSRCKHPKSSHKRLFLCLTTRNFFLSRLKETVQVEQTFTLHVRVSHRPKVVGKVGYLSRTFGKLVCRLSLSHAHKPASNYQQEFVNFSCSRRCYILALSLAHQGRVF